MVVKVSICGLDDERLEIDLCDTEEQLKDITVLDLKRRIKETKGIPELEQDIRFAGKPLKDDRPLSEYGVKDLSTLHMVRQQEPGAGGSDGSDEDGGMGDKKGKNKRVIRSELGRSYKHAKTTEMGVKVFIFGLRGEKFTINLCDTEEQLKDITVLDLKRWIKEREGIPELEQDIRFAGECLKDDRLLSDYGVKHESSLKMFRIHLLSDSEEDLECVGFCGAGGMGDRRGEDTTILNRLEKGRCSKRERKFFLILSDGSDEDGGMGDKKGKNRSKENMLSF